MPPNRGGTGHAPRAWAANENAALVKRFKGLRMLRMRFYLGSACKELKALGRCRPSSFRNAPSFRGPRFARWSLATVAAPNTAAVNASGSRSSGIRVPSIVTTLLAHQNSPSYGTTGSTMCEANAADAYTRCVAFT